ncbi:MAG: hypothetical protein ABI818_00205 [Acidobacteriota bacterium]
MFRLTRIGDFERMPAFLNALWHTYENGLKPNLRVRRSSVRAIAKEKGGPSDDLLTEVRERLRPVMGLSLNAWNAAPWRSPAAFAARAWSRS